MLKRFLYCAVFIYSLMGMEVFGGESHILLDSPYEGHKIEVVMHTLPNQKAPLLLFLHGASSAKGAGGISEEWFQYWREEGFAVASISLPGYGESTGRKDFCGPFTIGSLHCAIDAIKERAGVGNFGMISFGQGAMASLLLAAERSDIQCIVCANGGYDLFRHKEAGGALQRILLEKEYDLDFEEDAALTARSAIVHVAAMHAPVFLLHREGNPLVTEEEAIDFYHAMLRAGKECYLTLKERTSEAEDQRFTYKEVLAETGEWVKSKMDH